MGRCPAEAVSIPRPSRELNHFFMLRQTTLLSSVQSQKPVSSTPDFEPEIDKQGLQELLSIGPAHTSGTTLFKGLYEVLPGHYISYSKEGLYDEKILGHCKP